MESSNKSLSETTTKALKYIENILKIIELEIDNINKEIIEHKQNGLVELDHQIVVK